MTEQNKLVEVPTKTLKRMRFIVFEEIDISTKEREKVTVREIDGVLLIPVSDAKKWTGYSPQYIKKKFKAGELQPYFDNGEVCKVRRQGGKQLFFDLYEYLP